MNIYVVPTAHHIVYLLKHTTTVCMYNIYNFGRIYLRFFMFSYMKRIQFYLLPVSDNK